MSLGMAACGALQRTADRTPLPQSLVKQAHMGKRLMTTT